MDSVAGMYAVVTESTSVYVIDLDAMVFSRLRGLEDPTAATLRRDGEPVELLQIMECTVGKRMLLMLNLHVPGVAFTMRDTTPVQSIRLLPETSDGASDGTDG